MAVDLGDLVLLPSRMIYIKSIRALLFADSHIGLEYAMAEAGTFVPPIQYNLMRTRLLNAVREYRPKRIIIVGDLKHMFSQRTLQEHKEVLDMLKTLHSFGVEVFLVRGNHDNFIRGILEKHGVSFVPCIRMGEYLFIHGHASVPPDVGASARRIIMGHLHPTITLSDSISRARLPAFLVGERICILPAFTPLLPGLDIVSGITEDDYSTPIVDDFSNFEVFVIIDDRRVLKFGSVRNLIRLRESAFSP